jgi:quercetin dioxygenase-like cupin family protein
VLLLGIICLALVERLSVQTVPRNWWNGQRNLSHKFDLRSRSIFLSRGSITPPQSEENMKQVAYVLIASTLVIGLQTQSSQAVDAPKDNKGYTTGKTTVVDLGPEFAGMDGRQLRLRVLTIEPGGHIGLHSHKERPSVVYFLQGTDIVTREDGTSQTFKAGDVTAEPGTTVHWHRNDGKDAVVLITADIFKPSK